MFQTGPITGQPQWCTTKQEHLELVVPLTQVPEAIADTDYQEELLEWIGLILIGSPRLSSNDKIDPYICRYQLPHAFISDEQRTGNIQRLTHLRWRGLLSNAFVSRILWIVKEQQGREWFLVNGISFEGMTYTIMFGRNAEVLVWEMDAGSRSNGS